MNTEQQTELPLTETQVLTETVVQNDAPASQVASESERWKVWRINRELAYAVGHHPSNVFVVEKSINDESDGDEVAVETDTADGGKAVFRFDYRDPAIIWPIAERFDCFPYKTASGNWTTNLLAPSKDNMDNGVPSAALAVALTVIQEQGL